MNSQYFNFIIIRYIFISLCLILSLAKEGISSAQVSPQELDDDISEERQQPTTFISTLKSSATTSALNDADIIDVGNIHFEMPIPINKAAFEEGKQEYFCLLKGNMYYLLADMPYIEDPAKEKLIANWAIKLGFLPDTLQSIEKIARLKTMSFFSTIANTTEDQLMLAKSLLFICLLDDTCDEMTGALKHTNVSGTLNAFIAFFKGCYEYKPTNFPSYKSFVAAIVELRSSLESKKLDLAFYERSVEKWITALKWEYESRAGTNITETLYKKHRKAAVGADIIFEVACLLQGFTPPQETRRNLIVRSLREVALYKVFLINDVFSLPVELYNPSLNLIKMNIKESINNEEINFKLNKFINRYNKKVIEFCALEKQVPEVEDAKRYIKMMRDALNGYINWKFNTAKYRYPPRKIREETTKVIHPALKANL